MLSLNGCLLMQVLSRSGFKFENAWAAVLPGSTEGIYSFIAANYASGALQRRLERRGSRRLAPHVESLLGVLELGGASLQVDMKSLLPIPFKAYSP